MNKQPAPRTYRVEHHIDHHPGARLHWRLYTYGDGHWCVGNGYAGAFLTEAEADDAGRIWVATGLPRGDGAPELAAALETLAMLSMARREMAVAA